MSLEEKIEALMKSYISISSSNQELKNQNDYFEAPTWRGYEAKAKQKALDSPPESG